MDGSIEQPLSVDAAALSVDQRLDHLVEIEALLRRVSARRERCLAAVADPGDPRNFVREEVACLLRCSFGTAAGRLLQSENVVRRLPAALDAHEAGTISDVDLRILFELTFRLDDAVWSLTTKRAASTGSTFFLRSTSGRFAEKAEQTWPFNCVNWEQARLCRATESSMIHIHHT